MKIDSLSPSADRVGRYRVLFEDGTVLRLYRQTVEDFGLYAGMELSREEYDRLQSAASQMSAKMRALRIVAASNVSKSDLEQRLIHKGENPTDAQRAVSWMEDLSLLDDEKTARQIVDRCIAKGYGMARAKQALYEKRIPKEFWENVLADYPEQTDAIMEFLTSRLDGHSDEKEIRRAIDALLRRGHSYREVRRCLEQLNLDTEEFPEE